MRLPMKALAVAAVVTVISSMSLAFTFDRQVPDDIKAQMLNDLQFMNSIQGSGASQLHSAIYGQVSGGAYKNFFETRVMSIGMSRCGSADAVACVYTLRPTKMYLTQNFIQFSHPQVARMMVVYHEARHTEV